MSKPSENKRVFEVVILASGQPRPYADSRTVAEVTIRCPKSDCQVHTNCQEIQHRHGFGWKMLDTKVVRHQIWLALIGRFHIDDSGPIHPFEPFLARDEKVAEWNDWEDAGQEWRVEIVSPYTD